MHGSVRYQKLATDVGDEIESDCANEDSDDNVTVYIKQPADGLPEVVEKNVTCFRVIMGLVFLCIAVTFMLFEWYGWWQDLPDAGDGHDHHHVHEHASLYHHAVVLTSSDTCSSVGRRHLQEGGNVVDAAIASLLCLGVVHPHTAGIGGMFSAILYNNTSGSIKAIRSTGPQMPSTTYRVPSVLQGIKELHSRWGRAEWSRLFKEAIVLAKEGFVIDRVLDRALVSHKDKIVHSELCNLFCDANGHVKSEGAMTENRNLSALLLSASLNESHFLETLAVKLSEDLSLQDRPAILVGIQHSRGEISEPVIVVGDKYTVLSAASAFADPALSDILQRLRRRNLSLQSGTHFNSTALLNLIQELNDTSQVKNKTRPSYMFGNNMWSSHIGVLDSQGNFVIMCASLNSTWGSGRFLPSSGIVLNSFSANASSVDLPYSSFPLVINITDDDSDDDVEVVAFTGGLSDVFNAALLLHNRLDLGMSSKEALASPLLHVDQANASTLCLSTISNGSDVYMLLSDRQSELQKVEECPDHSQVMLLRLHAEHVGAYGAPAATSHANGY